jgi:DDE superfamily endonuclease
MNSNGSTCLITVDGTDCPIQEPTEFSRRWFSHKFKGPGLRYEIGICIQTGWVVWQNGPYPCGSWNDLRVARDSLYQFLLPGEKYIADAGYKDGGQFSITPSGLRNRFERMADVARARHENFNARIKAFKVFSSTFRNTREKHTRTTVNMLQLETKKGDRS